TPTASAQTIKLSVSVPSTSASLGRAGRPSLAPQLYLVFVPLAGVLLLGARPRNWRARFAGLALVIVCLLAMLACGGGGNSSGTNPVAYTIQIQGKANAQVVKITIASLTVE
ncbi:MAG: hypothetical protein WBW12_01740, partial [Terriglobales bacterium]